MSKNSSLICDEDTKFYLIYDENILNKEYIDILTLLLEDSFPHLNFVNICFYDIDEGIKIYGNIYEWTLHRLQPPFLPRDRDWRKFVSIYKKPFRQSMVQNLLFHRKLGPSIIRDDKPIFYYYGFRCDNINEYISVVPYSKKELVKLKLKYG